MYLLGSLLPPVRSPDLGEDEPHLSNLRRKTHTTRTREGRVDWNIDPSPPVTFDGITTYRQINKNFLCQGRILRLLLIPRHSSSKTFNQDRHLRRYKLQCGHRNFDPWFTSFLSPETSHRGSTHLYRVDTRGWGFTVILFTPSGQTLGREERVHGELLREGTSKDQSPWGSESRGPVSGSDHWEPHSRGFDPTGVGHCTRDTHDLVHPTNVSRWGWKWKHNTLSLLFPYPMIMSGCRRTLPFYNVNFLVPET